MAEQKPEDDFLNFDFEDEPRSDEGGFGRGAISDMMRKAIMTGVGAVFMGEEGIRNTLGEIKMPKEAMSQLVGQADRTKREVINALARELRQFLDGLELQELVKESLAGTTIEIQTKIKLIANEDGELGMELVENESEVTRDGDKPKKKSKKKAKKKASAKKD